VADFDFDKDLDFFSLLQTFGACKIVYPDALPVLISMLQHGLKDILKNQEDPDSPMGEQEPQRPSVGTAIPGTRSRSRSMLLQKELESRRKSSV